MTDTPTHPEVSKPPAGSRLDTFRRVARWVTLTSIFVNALFGIWALAGSLGEMESHILFTSLLITACGAVAAAASAAIPEGRLGVLPVAGIGIAVVGFALLIAGLWQDFNIGPVWQTGATLVIVSVGAAYASLLSGAHLPGRLRRLIPTAYGLAILAGAFLIAVTWGYDPGDSWRLFFITAVLLAAITIAVPITARLRSAEEGPPPVRHCPYCGGAVTPIAERTTDCPTCGRRFRVIGR